MAAASNPRHQPPSRIVPRWFWLTTSSAALLAVGLLGFWLSQGQTPERQASLPILTVAPGYPMNSQLSDNLPSPVAHGSVQVVTFVFQYCTTRCPAIGLGTEAADIVDKGVFEVVAPRGRIRKIREPAGAVDSRQPLTAARSPVKLPG